MFVAYTPRTRFEFIQPGYSSVMQGLLNDGLFLCSQGRPKEAMI